MPAKLLRNCCYVRCWLAWHGVVWYHQLQPQSRYDRYDLAIRASMMLRKIQTDDERLFGFCKNSFTTASGVGGICWQYCWLLKRRSNFLITQNDGWVLMWLSYWKLMTRKMWHEVWPWWADDYDTGWRRWKTICRLWEIHFRIISFWKLLICD